MQSCPYYLVTPSRVCELKWLLCRYWRFVPRHTLTGVWVEMNQQCYIKKLFLSHPHGCVSWNISIKPSIANNIKSHPHGCVSWNLIYCWIIQQFPMSHPHGCVSWNHHVFINNKRFFVTPSRVCELKYVLEVWNNVEICHTLTGVWVEIQQQLFPFVWECRHTLTGVWVEMICRHGWEPTRMVTPSRVCELKYCMDYYCVACNSVTPSRVCELKCNCWTSCSKKTRVCELKWYQCRCNLPSYRRHTLTGVWVEINKHR